MNRKLSEFEYKGECDLDRTCKLKEGHPYSTLHRSKAGRLQLQAAPGQVLFSEQLEHLYRRFSSGGHQGDGIPINRYN